MQQLIQLVVFKPCNQYNAYQMCEYVHEVMSVYMIVCVGMIMFVSRVRYLNEAKILSK